MTNPPAEFDALAHDYDAGMGDPLKRLVGETADVFLEHKADWLMRHVAPTGRLLDFGCGNGRFLQLLQGRAPSLQLVGCDVSAGMVGAAQRDVQDGRAPALHAVPPGPLPFADDEFDVVTALAVFHHIPPPERAGTIAEFVRVTRPGGSLVIFEHNPYNPVTRLVVHRAAIDANATLLPPRECLDLLARAGAVDGRIAHILFFPPRFRRLWRVERLLTWLPMGGQYVAIGSKAS